METTININKLQKRKNHAFGKDIYFLGTDKDGVNYWLEAAKWNCDWYWGFGYIETYTNNKYPSRSRDIQSHSHWDNSIVGKQDQYVHHINENKMFIETVLTENESWELSELMESFYALKNAAEVLGRGSSHISKNPCAEIIKNEDEVKRINEIVLPAIFAEVYKILTPSIKDK